MLCFKYLRPILFALLLSVAFSACKPREGDSGPSKTEIREAAGAYQLLVDGDPYFIKGAGMQSGNMEALAAHGANTFRTWRLSNGRIPVTELLDKADSLGLKVVMGLDVGLERKGFDYNDDKAVSLQLERIRTEVNSIKDHPALLLWLIGNELNHHAENPKVWDAVNDISKMIHREDPYHLTSTPLAGMNKEDVEMVMERAPDLDFLSVQMYGEIEILSRRIAESGYDGPLMITEWGATGYWEVPKTDWGAPIENNSSVKADYYHSRYQQSIAANSEQIIGSFVFLWGQKQERTPTWFGMFMPDGKESESIDVMHKVWKGDWPANRSPRLKGFSLDGRQAEDNIQLMAGDLYPAQVEVNDPDGDSLVYHWEIRRESESKATGGDRESVPELIPGLFEGEVDASVNFTAPSDSGAYRLFIYVEDGQNHVAHANIPFWVSIR